MHGRGYREALGGHGTLRTRLVVVRYGIVLEHRMTRTDALLQLGGLRLRLICIIYKVGASETRL
nr:hypothetical protein Q903MT_gene3156 [Picea sitchensis]